MIMIAALAVPGTNICFFDRVERLAESGRPLALVHLRNQNTYYCYNEAILDSVPRLVMSYYWMPADAAYRTFDSAEELGRGVRELSSSMGVLSAEARTRSRKYRDVRCSGSHGALSRNG